VSSHAHSDTPHAHGDGPHITPLGTYFTVFGCLLVLTVLTVLVSYMGLPSTLSIVVAMLVASAKATLVILWFMHLKYDTPFNRLVFASAPWFIALFFIFTMFDLSSRGDVVAITGNYNLRMDQATGQKNNTFATQADREAMSAARFWQSHTLRQPADLWGSVQAEKAMLEAAAAAAAAPASVTPSAAPVEGGHAAPAEGAVAPAEGAAAPAEGAAAPAEGAVAPAEGAVAPAEAGVPAKAP
jgi:caa(3)-type oxidase subunit IV